MVDDPDDQHNQEPILDRFNRHASNKHRRFHFRFMRNKDKQNQPESAKKKDDSSSILLKIPHFLRTSHVFGSIFNSTPSSSGSSSASANRSLQGGAVGGGGHEQPFHRAHSAMFFEDGENESEQPPAGTNHNAEGESGLFEYFSSSNNSLCWNNNSHGQHPLPTRKHLQKLLRSTIGGRRRMSEDNINIITNSWSYREPNLLNAETPDSVFRFQPFKFEMLDKKGIDDLVPLARSGHRLVSNRHYVYLFGGFNPSVSSSSRLPDEQTWRQTKPLFKELWRYSKLTQTWEYLSTGGTAPDELASHCAVMLDENQLLVFGGSGMPFGSASSNKMYICDLRRLYWAQVVYENEWDTREIAEGGPPQPREDPNVPLPAYGQAIKYDAKNGSIYICGGTTGFDYSLNLYEFKIQTKKWRLLALTPPANIEPRYRHEMALYDNKLFVIGGGILEHSFSMEKIPVFDLTEMKWSLLQSKPWRTPQGELLYPEPRYSHDCGQLGKRIYMVGGADQSRAFNDTWSLDLETLQWTKHLSASLPKPCYFHSATISEDGGEMFVFGGVNCISNKQRGNSMYRCWFGVPTLQKMATEALVKYLQHGNNLAMKKKRSLLSSLIPNPKPVMVDIKQIREYFDFMRINWQLLNLPEF